MKNWASALFPVLLTAASLVASAPLSLAQGTRDNAASFQVMETSIDDIHAAFKSGRLTAHQLVQVYLARIEAYDKQGPKINSIITLDAHALEDADRLDAAYKRSGLTGPMHGIPILVKDEIDVAGLATALGSEVFKGDKPTRDAFRFGELRKNVTIILGQRKRSEHSHGAPFC